MPHAAPRRISATALLMLGALALGGCRVSGPTTVDVGAGRYAEAFEDAQDVLRAQGFELERVDARAGVITTRPLASSGLWTPWQTVERRVRDEAEATFHRERRRAEVRFLGPEQSPPTVDAPVRADVDVRVERVYHPGVRASAASVRLRHVAEHADRPASADEEGVFAVDHSADRALASELARRLAERLGVARPAGAWSRRGAPSSRAESAPD